MTEAVLTVRRAAPGDAAGIVKVFEAVVAERNFSAIERPWTVTEEERYLEAMSAREAVQIAVSTSEGVVGCQSLDLYSSILPSMAHVAQLGTFVLPAWRGRGVGQALFRATRPFAVAAGYRKLVIHVRASNLGAQAFYTRLGFVECGRLKAQVTIDGRDDDEILMEMFLA